MEKKENSAWWDEQSAKRNFLNERKKNFVGVIFLLILYNSVVQTLPCLLQAVTENLLYPVVKGRGKRETGAGKKNGMWKDCLERRLVGTDEKKEKL